MLETILKKWIKKALFLTPYRIIRSCDANRFQAVAEALLSLRRRSYTPKVVIDGGANIGEFSRLVRSIFGGYCVIHLFEPQPACIPILAKLASTPNFHLHQAAIGSRHDESLQLAIDPSGVTTGAHVAISIEADGKVSFEANTVLVTTIALDRVFDANLSREDRALLKLDLQGWELEALKGARNILPYIEVILIEVSYYSIAYEPSIAEILEFLSDSGFALHDIASISARSRDNRAHQSDFVFVNEWSSLREDNSWK